jgi:hypothetical protein
MKRRWEPKGRCPRTLAALLAALLLALPALAGIWGYGSFENDDAVDWLDECITSDSTQPVAEALDTALTLDIIDVRRGAIAVAAAEVVAAALGKPSPSLPQDALAWVKRQPAEPLADLAPKARMALSRVSDAKVSKLRQVWSGGRANRWSTVVADLDARLAQ